MAEEKVAVKVEALNDDGERRFEYGEGADANEAVFNALELLREETGDDSFEMNDWRYA